MIGGPFYDINSRVKICIMFDFGNLPSLKKYHILFELLETGFKRSMPKIVLFEVKVK